MAIDQSGSRQLNGAILALNAGSSSLKFGLFASRPDMDEPSQVAIGARLDEQANEAGEKRLSSDASRILIERRPAQEEWAIARHVREVLACSPVAGRPLASAAPVSP